MVQELIRERKYRQEGAISEVSAKWGKAQTLIGLVLTVPYNAYTKVYDDDNDKYKLVQSREYAHFLPDQLIIEGEVFPEMRYRGIYEIIVYNSKLNLMGAFVNPNFEEWKIDEENIIWSDAFVSLGLSDLRGIQENASFNWNGKQYDFNAAIDDALSNYNGGKALINVRSYATTVSFVFFSIHSITIEGDVIGN